MATRLRPTGERVTLGQLRRRQGVSQQRLGEEMGTSQPAVTKIESACDPRLSTVRRFVEATARAVGTDGLVELTATIGEERYVIELAEPSGALAATDNAHAWRLRAWDDPTLEQAMIDGGFVAISADEIGDMTAVPTRDELRRRLRAAASLADRGEQAIGLFVTYWEIFRSRMAPGDLVTMPLTGRRVAIGEISSDYVYRTREPEPRLRHVRYVRWLVRGAPRSVLDDDVRKIVNAPGTVCAIAVPGALDRLRSIGQQP